MAIDRSIVAFCLYANSLSSHTLRKHMKNSIVLTFIYPFLLYYFSTTAPIQQKTRYDRTKRRKYRTTTKKWWFARDSGMNEVLEKAQSFPHCDSIFISFHCSTTSHYQCHTSSLFPLLLSLFKSLTYLAFFFSPKYHY